MRAIVAFLIIGLGADAALTYNAQRIIGGSVTTIQQYPFGAALLQTNNFVNFNQQCGGTILNNRSILSAAHCFHGSQPNRWRARVGSTWASSGGAVHQVQQFIMHPNYNAHTMDSDIAILRLASAISFSNSVRAGSIAGPNYNVADNQVVWAIGWGLTSVGGQRSEQLRHVQLWAINQGVCNNHYMGILNANMICAGVRDGVGRGQCTGDSGGPLLHNNVVVGVCSFTRACGDSQIPTINVRVSRFSTWIQNNS